MLVTFIILDAILFLQTLLIIGAVVVLIWTAKRMKESTDQIRESLLSVRPKVDEIIDRVDELVKTSQPVGGKLVEISADAKQISSEIRNMSAGVREMVESAKTSVSNVSELVNDISVTAKRQVSKADDVVTENLNRIEQLSGSVTTNLLGPLSEISAVLKGGYAAAKYFRRQHAPLSSEGDGQEEKARI